MALHPFPGRPGTFIDDADGSIITIADWIEKPPVRCAGCKQSTAYAIQSPTKQLFCVTCATNLGLERA